MGGLGPRGAYPLVGVVHLLPLPGSARGGPAAELAKVLDRARRDAAAYAEGGASALIVENFGDAPFAKEAVGPHVIAAMALAVDAVRREAGLPVGVNVLRNDVLAATAIAAMVGGAFVRANVYVGAALTDQGIIEGRADAVQSLIHRLDAPVAVWADLDVKHAAPIAPRPLAELAEDATERGLAAALIVTGRATGQPAALEDLRAAREGAPGVPLYVGSGATVERVPSLLAVAGGVIVGTAAKRDGLVGNPVDPDRVRRLAQAIEQTRRPA